MNNKTSSTRGNRQRTTALDKQRDQRRVRIIIGAAVVGVVVIALVLALVLGSNDEESAPVTTLAPSDTEQVVRLATSVQAAALDTVGNGDATNGPAKYPGTAITKDGLPELLYVGAEYCPFCAAERWSMVIALSRFGTFENLGVSRSASNDVYPNTPTFTFYGSTYTSEYLAFTPVETATNEPNGSGGYKPLQELTDAQTAVVQESGASGIPFLSFGGKYLISGATYDPGVLKGLTALEVARSLGDVDSAVGRSILGAANGITAAICGMTGNQPAAVCESAGVQAAAKIINA